jgi:hypothetical protein
MTTGAESQDRTEIVELLSAYHKAMVDARPDRLDALVASDFSLVHITGYVQPKREWFAVIRSGEFDYHRIEIAAESLKVIVSGDSATASGAGVFHATISGMNAPWRLLFRIQLRRRGSGWTILHAEYSSG